MVVRDRDILAEMGRAAGATVYLSVPTVDEAAWSALEPGTAHPLQRLRAVRQLRDAGVDVGVLMAPVVPGFMTRPEQLESTVKAIADHGAAFVGANVMFLKDGTREHFFGFIRREFPQMLEGFEKLYAGPYAPPGYVGSVRAMVATLQKRYGIGPRRREHTRGLGEQSEESADEKAACEQAAFRW
jgi:DNA repair photolyase